MPNVSLYKLLDVFGGVEGPPVGRCFNIFDQEAFLSDRHATGDVLTSIITWRYCCREPLNKYQDR